MFEFASSEIYAYDAPGLKGRLSSVTMAGGDDYYYGYGARQE